MNLSLVIPCYNEVKNISLLLDRCAGLGQQVEIILVDNGSTDDTPSVLEKLLPQYPNCRSVRVDKNQGYGYGILKGLNAATGDVIGWTHADMQTDPMDALKGLQFFNSENMDVFVKGRRYGRPLVDVFFTFGMSVILTLLLRHFFWDVNAQPSLFSRRFYERWVSPPHDFSLDLYAYNLARVHKLKVRRFPVKFGARAFGESHWNSGMKARYKFIKRTLVFSLELYRKTNNGYMR